MALHDYSFTFFIIWLLLHVVIIEYLLTPARLFPREGIAILTLESLHMSTPVHPGIMSNAHTFTQQVMIENLPRFVFFTVLGLIFANPLLYSWITQWKWPISTCPIILHFKINMNKYNINNFSVDVIHCMRAIFMIIWHDNLWFGVQFGLQFHRWCSLTIYW